MLRAIGSTALVALPPVVIAAYLAFDPATTHAWTLVGVAAVSSIVIAWSRANARDRSLRTIVSVLSAYREGDFSVRARTEHLDVVLRDVLGELNQLGDVLRSHRLGEMEAWSLLRKVMAEVDVVVLAIDEDKRVRLANDAAARLLGRSSNELIGTNASELGLDDALAGSVPRMATIGAGNALNVERWELRRGSFRLSGEAQTLIVLSDVSRTLRDNERDAWRRLIRVMGHEINNSLSPIKSISESLLPMADAARRAKNAEWETDLRDGLGVIARRAEALSRFMTSYAAIAKLPPPQRKPTPVKPLLEKSAALETRARVVVDVAKEAESVTWDVDADQLEQVLINLLKNAAEVTPKGGEVRASLSVVDDELVIRIEDDGPGVSETANLFVPFFTTKPDGTGIGLALSRQIIEAHDGQLTLTSKSPVLEASGSSSGAVATIRLPKAAKA